MESDSPAAPARVAGVDGCHGGWLILTATAERDGFLGRLSSEIVPRFETMLGATASCTTVVVDVPIGLCDAEPRQADREARRMLGRPRGSSVFPAPVRAVLEAAIGGYEAACAASSVASGRRLSRQTFSILPKIREADAAMTPSLQARVIEGHPEVSFQALNHGTALASNKRTATGRARRRALLETIVRGDLPSRLTPGAVLDDLYDACVLAWTAARVTCNAALRIPAEPPLDGRGLRMEIVC